MNEHRIIIDCDPGIDDCLALLLAAAYPHRIALLGVTTVAGNVSLARTTENARRILSLAGRPDVPVHAGSAQAIAGPGARAAQVHGADGIGGVLLPESMTPLASEAGVAFLIESLLAAPAGSITLCVTGPMTNIARALGEAPEIAERCRALVFMGGAAFVAGNMGTAGRAEFNIFTDPKAAAITLAAPFPRVVMFGLDLTRQAAVTGPRLAALEVLPTASAKAAAAMIGGYGRAEKYLHDPNVIAWLLAPELYRGEAHSLTVELAPGDNYGRTLAAPPENGPAGARPVLIMKELAAEGFFRLLNDSLARLP